MRLMVGILIFIMPKNIYASPWISCNEKRYQVNLFGDTTGRLQVEHKNKKCIYQIKSIRDLTKSSKPSIQMVFQNAKCTKFTDLEAEIRLISNQVIFNFQFNNAVYKKTACSFVKIDRITIDELTNAAYKFQAK